jgi:hypothetical protein
MNKCSECLTKITDIYQYSSCNHLLYYLYYTVIITKRSVQGMEPQGRGFEVLG